jgi:hypothetical protein
VIITDNARKTGVRGHCRTRAGFPGIDTEGQGRRCIAGGLADRLAVPGFTSLGCRQHNFANKYHFVAKLSRGHDGPKSSPNATYLMAWGSARAPRAAVGALADRFRSLYRKWRTCKDVVGDGADHHTRGACAPQTTGVPSLGEDLRWISLF